MKLKESVARIMGDRVAKALAALKIDCAGVEGVSAKASAMNLSAGAAGVFGHPGMSVLAVQGIGWSPSLHRCDLDIRIAVSGTVTGTTAYEDLVLLRVRYALGIQRARAEAFRRLVEEGVVDDEGDEDFRVKPLTRSAAGAGPLIDHLLVDAATLHAARIAGLDHHSMLAAAGKMISDLHRETPHRGFRDLQNAVCAVFETNVDDVNSPPDEDPDALMDAAMENALRSGAAHVQASHGAAEWVVETRSDQPHVGSPADRHLAFQVKLEGGASVLGDRVRVPGTLPETALDRLAGRELGDLVRLGAGLDDRRIVEAKMFTDERGPATWARLESEPWPIVDAEHLPSAK